MTMETQTYSRGGWIVHLHHGVGQIQGTEIMHVGGRKNPYCKVKTRNSAIWVRLGKLNNENARSIQERAGDGVTAHERNMVD